MMRPLIQRGGKSHNLQEKENEIVLSKRPAARSWEGGGAGIGLNQESGWEDGREGWVWESTRFR